MTAPLTTEEIAALDRDLIAARLQERRSLVIETGTAERLVALATLTSVGSTSERVWAALEADPDFVAAMEQSRADFAAGRTTRYRLVPVPTDAPGPGLLDGLVDEVREAILEADAQDCSSADCIADAVYEIVRDRVRRAASPAPSRAEGLNVEALIAELSESPLPGARYAVAVVRAHVARLSDTTTEASDG